MLGKYSDSAPDPQLTSFGFWVTEAGLGVLGIIPFQNRTGTPSPEEPGSVYTEAGESHGLPKVL